jgi:ABC-type uncharacterized transport system substrate-binding protein
MIATLKRRDFITLLGGAAAAWPLAAQAQQPAMATVGILASVSLGPYARFIEAIKQGLREAGYVEGRNVTIEYRWADGQYDRLPQLATELVDRGVAVIILVGGRPHDSSRQDRDSETRKEQLIVLSTRHALTVFSLREFPAAGGLMSYGPSLADAYVQQGIYAGRILKSEKPAEMPVQQAVKVELVINLQTAKTLGLSIPLPLLGRADEVIE